MLINANGNFKKKRYLWKIVIVAIVVMLIGGYCYRKEQLAAEYRAVENRVQQFWFQPSVGNRLRAIEEWNKEGLLSFVKKENINEIMKEYEQRFFGLDSNEMFLNREGWYQINDLKEYSDDEIKNAMLLILYGTNGIQIGDKTYISSFNDVRDIPVYLFLVCISELNCEIAQNAEDFAVEDWWRIKRRSYE